MKPMPVISHSPFTSLQPLATIDLLSIYMDFPVLDISYK